MAISAERRGKYAGAKLHLDGDDCRIMLDALATADNVPLTKMARKMAKAIQELLAQQPDLLSPRTPAQIEAELQEEHIKAGAKLAKLQSGLSWTGPVDDFRIIVMPTGAIQTFYKKAFAEWSGWDEFVHDGLVPAHVPFRVTSLVAPAQVHA